MKKICKKRTSFTSTIGDRTGDRTVLGWDRISDMIGGRAWERSDNRNDDRTGERTSASIDDRTGDTDW